MSQPGAELPATAVALRDLAKGIPREEHEQYPDWKKRLARSADSGWGVVHNAQPMFAAVAPPAQSWTYSGSMLSSAGS